MTANMGSMGRIAAGSHHTSIWAWCKLTSRFTKPASRALSTSKLLKEEVKPPPPPFASFYRDHVDSLRESNPGLKNAEIRELASTMWANDDAVQQKYSQLFQIKMDAFQQQEADKSGTDDIPTQDGGAEDNVSLSAMDDRALERIDIHRKYLGMLRKAENQIQNKFDVQLKFDGDENQLFVDGSTERKEEFKRWLFGRYVEKWNRMEAEKYNRMDDSDQSHAKNNMAEERRQEYEQMMAERNMGKEERSSRQQMQEERRREYEQMMAERNMGEEERSNHQQMQEERRQEYEQMMAERNMGKQERSNRQQMQEERRQEYEQMMAEGLGDYVSIPENYSIGRIIGPQGSTIRAIQDKYDVFTTIKEENGERRVYIQGSNEACERAKLHIEQLVHGRWNLVNWDGMRGISFLGLAEDENVVLGSEDDRTVISSCPSVSGKERSYENIEGLKEMVLNVVDHIKSDHGHDSNSLLSVLIHYGMIDFRQQPGSIDIASLRSMRTSRFNHWTSDYVDFRKLEKLPSQDVYTKFDIRLFGRDPYSTFNYTMFAKQPSDDSQPAFIDIEDVSQINESKMALGIGPGYFHQPDHKYSRIDVIDPKTNMTNRVSFIVAQPTLEHNENLETHTPALKAFLENIKLTMQGNDIGLDLPPLDNGYMVTDLSRSEVNQYQFEKGFSTSLAEKLCCDTGVGCGVKEKDVRHENKELHDLVVTDISCGDVADRIEKELAFSETILKYLF